MKSGRSDLHQQRMNSPVVPPPSHLVSSFRPREESGKLTQLEYTYPRYPHSATPVRLDPTKQSHYPTRSTIPQTQAKNWHLLYCTLLLHTHRDPRAVASINQASTSVPPSPTRTRLERETRTHLYLYATAVRAPLQPQQPRPQRALARET